MFSAPQDNVTNATGALTSASWITATPATAMSAFWGMRNANEGVYGNFVATNWLKMGGTGVGTTSTGGGGTVAASSVNIGDGSGATLANGAQQLVLTSPDATTWLGPTLGVLENHCSTAVNFVTPANIGTAWDYLFTANNTD
jgi:hypothetical protein